MSSPQAASPGPKPLSASGPNEPILYLEPRFVPKLQVLGYLPFALFLGLWGGGFFGGFSMVLFDLFDVSAARWVPFLGFGALFTLLVPFLLLRVQKKAYGLTHYALHSDRLDYMEGLFSVVERTVPLAEITEVTLRRGALQKDHGLGTIILSTPDNDADSTRTRAGIHLVDIEHPDQACRDIRSMVEKARRGTEERLAA